MDQAAKPFAWRQPAGMHAGMLAGTQAGTQAPKRAANRRTDVSRETLLATFVWKACVTQSWEALLKLCKLPLLPSWPFSAAACVHLRGTVGGPCSWPLIDERFILNISKALEKREHITSSFADLNTTLLDKGLVTSVRASLCISVRIWRKFVTGDI